MRGQFHRSYFSSISGTTIAAAFYYPSSVLWPNPFKVSPATELDVSAIETIFIDLS
jgi:hypothetical protein